MNLENVKHLTINNRNVVRFSIGGSIAWKGLPKGYVQLDYIQSTGQNKMTDYPDSTPYIDTGVIPNQNSRIICEFMFKSGTGIYGARTDTGHDNFAFRSSSSKWQGCYGTSLGPTGVASDTVTWHIAEHNKNLFYLDGVLLYTHTYEEFTPNKSIILGGINASNTVYGGTCLYRSCQIYAEDVLVRDFIPCKSPGGEIGMYDTLNAVFYGNAGTGEFVAGAEL